MYSICSISLVSVRINASLIIILFFTIIFTFHTYSLTGVLVQLPLGNDSLCVVWLWSLKWGNTGWGLWNWKYVCWALGTSPFPIQTASFCWVTMQHEALDNLKNNNTNEVMPFLLHLFWHSISAITFNINYL